MKKVVHKMSKKLLTTFSRGTKSLVVTYRRLPMTDRTDARKSEGKPRMEDVSMNMEIMFLTVLLLVILAINKKIDR